jgi:large-conductance mechanosensitive channel
MMVRGLNKLMARLQLEKDAAPPALTTSEQLLTEIRDSLKAK